MTETASEIRLPRALQHRYAAARRRQAQLLWAALGVFAVVVALTTATVVYPALRSDSASADSQGNGRPEQTSPASEKQQPANGGDSA